MSKIVSAEALRRSLAEEKSPIKSPIKSPVKSPLAPAVTSPVVRSPQQGSISAGLSAQRSPSGVKPSVVTGNLSSKSQLGELRGGTEGEGVKLAHPAYI